MLRKSMPARGVVKGLIPLWMSLCALAMLSCGSTSDGHQVLPADPTITSFTAAASTITAGTSTTLTGVFQNGAGSVDHGLGAVTSGTPISTGDLSVDTTFTLAVTGETGTTPATSQLTVHVAPMPSTPVISAPTSLLAGQAGYTASVPLQPGMTFEWVVSGGTLTGGAGTAQIVFSAGPVGTLQLTCQAVNAAQTKSATGSASIPVTQAPVGDPGITAFEATPTIIDAGASSLLTWTVTNATSVSLDQGIGAIPLATTQKAVSPAVTTTYTLIATGAAGTKTATKSVTVTVQAAPKTFTLATGVTLEMVAIPKGTFTMGKTGFFYAAEHQVTLTQDFFIGKCLITQAQYQALMATNPSKHNGDGMLPVERVSWTDLTQANGFLDKLNAVTKSTRPAGLSFRLPTVAEWEYACKAGTTTIWYFGDAPTQAQFEANCWCYSATSQPVAGLLANPFGLYDMVGNVKQWCADDPPRFTSGAQNDPVGDDPGTSGDAEYRGGAYHSEGDASTASAYRMLEPTSSSYEDLGFRVVLAAPISFNQGY